MYTTAGGRIINFYHTPFFFPLQEPSPSKSSFYTHLKKKKIFEDWFSQDYLYLILFSVPLRNNYALRSESWAVQGPEPILGIDNL